MRRNSEREVVAGVAPGFAKRGYIARQGAIKQDTGMPVALKGPGGAFYF